jgi:hypothetical protein
MIKKARRVSSSSTNSRLKRKFPEEERLNDEDMRAIWAEKKVHTATILLDKVASLMSYAYGFAAYRLQ